MARLSELEYAKLAALLSPAALFVSTFAAGLTPPTASDPKAWEQWLVGLAEDKLAAFLDKLPANDDVRAAAATLRSTPSALADETPHLVLKGPDGRGLPVVDRIDIWKHLKSLHTGGYRILQVRGQSRVGKSYIRWLVQEYCNALGGGHDVRYHDLVGVLSLKQIALNVVERLGGKIDIKDPDSTNTTPQAWARGVADLIFPRIIADGQKTRWLVFDHFERVKSDEATLFFAQLADLVAVAARDPDVRNGPRLVLIDHGVELTDIARLFAVGTEVRIANTSDVERFVRLCNNNNIDLVDKAKEIYTAARSTADQLMKEIRDQDPNAVVTDPFMRLLQLELEKFLRGDDDDDGDGGDHGDEGSGGSQ